jgi:hypothetical protein
MDSMYEAYRCHPNMTGDTIKLLSSVAINDLPLLIYSTMNHVTMEMNRWMKDIYGLNEQTWSLQQIYDASIDPVFNKDYHKGNGSIIIISIPLDELHIMGFDHPDSILPLNSRSKEGYYVPFIDQDKYNRYRFLMNQVKGCRKIQSHEWHVVESTGEYKDSFNSKRESIRYIDNTIRNESKNTRTLIEAEIWYKHKLDMIISYSYR